MELQIKPEASDTEGVICAVYLDEESVLGSLTFSVEQWTRLIAELAVGDDGLLNVQICIGGDVLVTG